MIVFGMVVNKGMILIMSSEKQLQIIKDICQEHLDNTEINSINKCEDHHDHYLLGKVDMATEIFEAIMKGK